MTAKDRTHELLQSGSRQVSLVPPRTSRQDSYQLQDRVLATDFTIQISNLLAEIEQIDASITTIAQHHEKAILSVSQHEISQLTLYLDTLQDKTLQKMDVARTSLNRLAAQTKNLQNTSKVRSRKAQQSLATIKLQNTAQRYASVQKQAKNQYKKRIERELKIARPDASPKDIQYAVNSGDRSAFAQEMLNCNSSQRKALQAVQGRKDEMNKLEISIEELAVLFTDLQALLETQQDQMEVIETQVDYAAVYIEDGGNEIKKAITFRKASRNKLWFISIAVLVIIVIVVVIVYTQVSKTTSNH